MESKAKRSWSLIDRLSYQVYRCGLICDPKLLLTDTNDQATEASKYYNWKCLVGKCLHLLWRSVHSIYFTLCLIYSLNKHVHLPKYYLEIVQSEYLGGIKPFFYMIDVLYAITAAELIFVFNFSGQSKYEWLKVLEIFDDKSWTKWRLLLTNNDIKQIKVRVKFSLNLIPRITSFIMCLMLILSVYLMVSVHDRHDFIVYGIPTIAHYLSFGYASADTIFYTILCYFIVIESCTRSLLNVNRLAVRVRAHFRDNHPIRWSTLVSHYSLLLNRIQVCNRFWKRVNFVLFYNIFSLNMLQIQQIIFGNYLNPIVTLLVGTLLVLTFVTSIYICLRISSINTIANKSHGILLKLKAESHLNDRREGLKVCRMASTGLT